jgi:hypothetical protein
VGWATLFSQNHLVTLIPMYVCASAQSKFWILKRFYIETKVSVIFKQISTLAKCRSAFKPYNCQLTKMASHFVSKSDQKKRRLAGFFWLLMTIIIYLSVYIETQSSPLAGLDCITHKRKWCDYRLNPDYRGSNVMIWKTVSPKSWPKIGLFAL